MFDQATQQPHSIALADLTNQDLVHSLRNERCPACGCDKRPRETLCQTCYFKLPKFRRKSLYARVGEGYLENVRAALSDLNVTHAEMP